MEAKMDFPIGKKVVPFYRKPRYGAEPITRWDTKIASESVTVETGIMKVRETFKWNNRGKGPTFLDFPLFPGTSQWDEPTKRLPFTAQPKFPEMISTKWKASEKDSLSQTG